MSVFGSKIPTFHCFSPKNHCWRPRRRNSLPGHLYFGRLWRPLLLDLALTRRPGLSGRPRVIHPLGLQLQWGGGTKRAKKLRKLKRSAKINKPWKSHKKATPIHGEDAANGFEINWAKHYPNCEQ